MKRLITVLFKLIVKMIDRLPKKYIVFESLPDFSDNSWALYQFIVHSHLFKKYKPVWITNTKIKHNNKKVKSVYRESNLSKYYIKRSCAIVFSNLPISRRSDRQVSIFLCHGSKSKKTRGKYEAPKDLDYILVQADIFKDALRYEYNLSDKTQMVTLGYPRNDDLMTDCNIHPKSIFNFDCEKLVVWYPTFRQHKNGTSNVSSIALPIVHDEKSANILNKCAEENRVLILLKPHFAQDVQYIKNKNYSNLKIIDDDFLAKNNIRSYQLLSMSDALLTDYSSVYYDYLLKDSPIGLVWEDYDEYKKKQGFALDPDVVYTGGEKILNVYDFCMFIKRVSEGVDALKDERAKIRDMTNVYLDANSSERVAKFILEKIKLL